MPKLSPRVKIVLIVCATILLMFIIFALFRSLQLGIITFDNLMDAIKLFMDGNEKAMIGML